MIYQIKPLTSTTWPLQEHASQKTK